MGVYKNQPVKLAAFEGHYKTGPGDLYLFGWVDEENKEVKGVAVPGLLSLLVDFNTQTPIQGLDDTPKEMQPPVQITFQTYHIMITLGMMFIGLIVLAYFFKFKKTLFEQKWLMYLFVIGIFLPHVSSLAGWIATEVGRQPWAVQGILLTKDAISKVVTADQVMFSLIMFTLVYIILLILFVYLLVKKIKAGPEAVANPSAHTPAQV